LCRYFPPVQGNDAPADRKPQAASAIFGARASGASEKSFEYALLIFHRDPRSFIIERNLPDTRIDHRTKGDVPFGGRCVECIG
jgi:hypothetical protein